jgi:TolB-like protein/Tfp pilus assembly protein PilF
MENLWLRLKERKLVQWALAYLAGAWLLLQVLDVLGQNFDWPRSVFRSATVLLGIGFLAALVLAWYHGEQGRQRMGGVELLMLTGILVVAGVAMALVGRGEDAQAEARLGGAAPEITLPRAERNSVAVLPFANLSESRENEYFSDGITDEILTTLANVRDLRVISRTSVMQYKGTSKPLRQIASELGVAHILEGSVQRAGERVRINAQLIDVQTDQHLWAERFDRPLEDIFTVQSEIAQQIARALQAELSPVEQARLERRPTTNLVAYDFVLRARNLLQIPDRQTYEAALELIHEALVLDPTYSDAFAARAIGFRGLYWFHGEAGWLDSAVVAARRAITLDPDFAPGYEELGNALTLRGNREAAFEAHRRAVELNPNLSAGLANLYDYDFGRLDEAAHLWERTLETDPTNAIFLWLAGRTYLHLGMPERARALFGRAKKVQPAFHWLGYFASLTFLAEGRPQQARAEVQRTLAETRNSPDAMLWAGQITAALGDLSAAGHYFERGLPEPTSTWEKERAELTLAWILQQSGEAEQARRLLQEASSRFKNRRRGHSLRPEDYAESAQIRVVAGDHEGAIRELQEAVRNGWRHYLQYPGDPILNSLRGDPRYDRLMAEVRADVDRMRARVEREGW